MRKTVANITYGLFAKWLTSLELSFHALSKSTSRSMQVTRLCDSLRFWTGGQLFATLDFDSKGLIFSDCTMSDTPQDHVSLNFAQARHLLQVAVGKLD
jgi:hypothetical protein